MTRASSSVLDSLDELIAVAPAGERPGLVVALAARLAALGAGLSAPAAVATEREETEDVPTGARRLGMSPRYIYKHPELPFVLRVGRRLLLSSRGIDRFIAQRAGKA